MSATWLRIPDGLREHLPVHMLLEGVGGAYKLRCLAVPHPQRPCLVVASAAVHLTRPFGLTNTVQPMTCPEGAPPPRRNNAAETHGPHSSSVVIAC